MMPIDVTAFGKAFIAKIEYYYFCFVNGQMPSFSEHDIFILSLVIGSIFSSYLGYFLEEKLGIEILGKSSLDTGSDPSLKGMFYFFLFLLFMGIAISVVFIFLSNLKTISLS